MKYADYINIPKSFRSLNGFSKEQFMSLLPYFSASHDHYLTEYEMNGKSRKVGCPKSCS